MRQEMENCNNKKKESKKKRLKLNYYCVSVHIKSAIIDYVSTISLILLYFERTSDPIVRIYIDLTDESILCAKVKMKRLNDLPDLVTK